MKTIFKILIIFTGLLVTTTSLTADQRPRAGYVRVLVNNETSYELSQLYYATIGSDTWSDDLLGSDTIPPYESLSIDIPQGNLTLIAAYEIGGTVYYVEKDYRFRVGQRYTWPIIEENEPVFAEASAESYGYMDEDPYGYYEDYDAYGYYDGPYGY